MEAIWKSKYVRIWTIILLLQATLFYTASHGDSKPLNKPLADFPQSLPGYRMIRQGVVEKDTMDILKADDVLSRLYVRTPPAKASQLTPEQAAVVMASAADLFVAYFSTQQQGQSPHSPKNCLPGSGWQPVDTGELTIPLAASGASIKINKYVIVKGESQSLVLYWYQSHGRVVANEFAAKFYLVADSLRYHRSDTALVRVVVPVVHDDLAGALDEATSFVQAVFPAVYRYLPM
jgi:EpsI family protein